MGLNKINYKYSDYVLKKYFCTVGNEQGFLNNNSVLIGVSGGGDSVALLWMFKKFYENKIIVAHINHNIRDNSNNDAEFVKNLCGKWNLKFILSNVDINRDKLKGESIETSARRIRQQELINIAENNNINSIILGHNLNDMAETVLFNILRGTGIRGASGILPVSEIAGIKFYRPLINLTRGYLREILRLRNIKWCEDYTNNDTDYTRNFIRLKLIPFIEKNINSGVINHLANFGNDLRILRDHEELKGHELLKLAKLENDKKLLRLNIKFLRRLSDYERKLLIRESGRELNLITLSRNKCEKFSELIKKSGSFEFQWGGGVFVIASEGVLTYERSN